MNMTPPGPQQQPLHLVASFDFSLHRTFHRRRAFSLVEVVIAIGIISFALIPILGLLGISSQSFHQAARDSVTSRIISKLAANAQQSSLDGLLENPSQTHFFDFEGRSVPSADDPMRVYTATVAIGQETHLLNSTHFYKVLITVSPLDVSQTVRGSIHIFPQR